MSRISIRGALPPNALLQFVIYDHPKDHPKHFVVRAWVILGAELIPFGMVWPFRTLEAARGAIPEGLHCMPRFEDDDPCIVEVWT